MVYIIYKPIWYYFKNIASGCMYSIFIFESNSNEFDQISNRIRTWRHV